MIYKPLQVYHLYRFQFDSPLMNKPIIQSTLPFIPIVSQFELKALKQTNISINLTCSKSRLCKAQSILVAMYLTHIFYRLPIKDLIGIIEFHILQSSFCASVFFHLVHSKTRKSRWFLRYNNTGLPSMTVFFKSSSSRECIFHITFSLMKRLFYDKKKNAGGGFYVTDDVNNFENQFAFSPCAIYTVTESEINVSSENVKEPFLIFCWFVFV